MGAWLWGCVLAMAQDAPVITPELLYRPRLELRGDDAAGFVGMASHRARIGLSATADELGARVVVQDVRFFGEELDTLADDAADGLDVRIAEVSGSVGETEVTVGRQELGLHEERLVGSVRWAQQGRSFDGVLVSSRAGALACRGSSVWVRDAARIEDPALATSQTLSWGTVGWAGEPGIADAVYVLDTDTASDRVRHTAGGFHRLRRGRFAYRVEAYGQFGVVSDATIAAWMGALQAEVALGNGDRPARLMAWYDHLSGDTDPLSGTVTTFQTLFATNHKFYGRADYFVFQSGGPADGRGLQDAALKFRARPTSAFGVAADAHLFLTGAPAPVEVLGSEVDAWGAYRLTDQVSWELGGAVVLLTDGAPRGWAFSQFIADFH